MYLYYIYSNNPGILLMRRMVTLSFQISWLKETRRGRGLARVGEALGAWREEEDSTA